MTDTAIAEDLVVEREIVLDTQPRLPLDVDEPIPFAPTAAARRQVAPETLPGLRLVPVGRPARPTPSRAAMVGDVAPVVDAADPRRVRARALVRAGLDVAAVAADLRVDESAVVVWTADLPVRGARSGRVTSPPVPATSGEAVPSGHAASGPAAQAPTAADPAAVAEVVTTARRDGRYAAGLALVAANARTTPHGVVVRVEGTALAARLLRWLLDVAEVDPLRLRVIAVVAPDAAGDRVRHELLRGSSLPADRLHVSRSAQDRPAVVLRVSDLATARRVEQWQAAVGVLLDGPREAAG